MLRTLIIVALVATPSFAFAQSQSAADTTPARCLLGSKTFSPGATIRASSTVNVCNPDGTWGITQQTSSGCFFNDAFYSVGATSSVSGNKTMTATCTADGTWSSAPAPAAAG
jgi:hypothetical protein